MTEVSEARGARYQMIHSIDVRNFRCFEKLNVSDCARLNIVVGDNGAGKTALLEAIFLALGSTSEIGARVRSQRGLDGAFNGPNHRIEGALWGGFFYNHDMSLPISVTLDGDGEESRSVEITRNSGQDSLFKPLESGADQRESTIRFNWRDHTGEFRSAVPTITDKGLVFPGTGETLEHFFYFPANQTIGSVENASRFSELSQANTQSRFIELFTQEYNWIENLNVEVYGGSPVLFATLAGTDKKQPLPNVSSGINRAVSFMLAIASSQKGIVLIDEIENGIHHSHLGGIWRALLAFTREYDCQLIISTHSQECLIALSKAAGKNMDDISLWQVERGQGGSSIKQFEGEDLRLALEYNEEVR